MRLQALRGVALVIAVTLVTEVGDLRRFASPKQLMAFPRAHAGRALQRRQHPAAGDHEGGQLCGPNAPLRSGLELSVDPQGWFPHAAEYASQDPSRGEGHCLEGAAPTLQAVSTTPGPRQEVASRDYGGREGIGGIYVVDWATHSAPLRARCWPPTPRLVAKLAESVRRRRGKGNPCQEFCVSTTAARSRPARATYLHPGVSNPRIRVGSTVDASRRRRSPPTTPICF